MKKTIEKVMKTGYGIGLLSLAEAKKIAHAVKDEFDLNEPESKRLAQELMRTSRTVSKDVVKIVGKHFESALLRSGFVEKSDVAAVKGVVKHRVIPKLRQLRMKESTLQKLKRKVSRKRRQ